MISKVSREKIDLAVGTFKAQVAPLEEKQVKLSDLYERATSQAEPASDNERVFRQALRAMNAALSTYNEQLSVAGEDPVTLQELLPQTMLQTADMIKDQSEVDGPSISPVVAKLQNRLESTIVGQKAMLEGLMISFMTGGHILLEGAPGVGKTESVKVLADSLIGEFARLQFNPDLSASDVTGDVQYDEEKKGYEFKKGPIFCDFLLADEINRGMSKTQSSLLEAMAERQVTTKDGTRKVSGLFTVVATQNPLDMDGTFPLPAAQLDRFMLCVKPPFPTEDEEIEIDERKKHPQPKIDADISLEELAELRAAVSTVEVPEELLRYASRLKNADPNKYLKTQAGPRATFSLKKAAQARAYINGRTVISEEDIRAMFPAVIQHRVELKIDHTDRGITVDDYIKSVLESVAVPAKAS